MKKRLFAGILSVLALLTLCACSAGKSNNATNADWPLTIQDMLDANAMGTLSMTYGSMRADYVRPETGEYDPETAKYAYEIVMEYADTQYFYHDFVSMTELYALDGSSGYAHLRNAEGAYQRLEYRAFLQYEPTVYSGGCFALDPDSTALEKIVNVETDGDKTIMTTNVDTKVLRPIYQRGDGIFSYEFPFEDGDKLENVYTLNAEDYALLGVVTTVIHADATREETERVTITYGAEMPEDAAALAARKESDDACTVTIKVNPGTPDEHTQYATGQKGDVFSYTPPAGYTVYADADYTTPLNDVNAFASYFDVTLDADSTWYAVKNP